MPKRAAKAAPAEPKNPLAEVFGFTVGDKSARALHFQENRLCPFNNIVPLCTKVSVVDPLGVCSLYERGEPTVICPVRFKEDWMIATHAAEFFFSGRREWTAMPEVRLTDKNGKSAGNIDLVLVEHDHEGKVTDFGAVEIQAVYISGNVRRPFRAYTEELTQTTFDWSGRREYPRPDYLSSSRKRLAPQLIYKGGILKSWNKKSAVVIDRKFFGTLPRLREVSRTRADIAWLVYDLEQRGAQYHLTPHTTVYTEFGPALDTITKTEAGPVVDFIKTLEKKLKKLKKGEPVADTSPDDAVVE
jgi:Restriction endonuclease NotI